METIITILTFEVLKSVHRNTFFIFHRISVTCKDYTYCRIILKLKVYLGITATGKDLKEARKNAYEATEWITFANKYMRHDIGKAIDEA